MESYKIISLFNRYLENRCSATEVEVLMLHFHTDNADLLSDLVKEELQKDTVAFGNEINDTVERVHGKLRAAILANIDQELLDERSSHMKRRLWPRIAVAVAMVAGILFGIWFLNMSRQLEGMGTTKDLLVKNDIAPGKNTATITLANGNRIELSDAKTGVVVGENLKYNDGTQDSALAKAISPKLGDRSVMLTASTPRGGTYQITLPDGSQVRLNADTKITFPSKFIGNERRVILQGEAYFKVVHNARQPFRVESKGQVVEDIGTEFNINAYVNESAIKTTLVEGLARVSSVHSLSASGGEMSERRRGGREEEIQSVILKANQQSILVDNSLSVGIADRNATAWINGKFRFDNTSLEDVMKQLARWYDVEVVYPDGIPNVRFTGGINRNSNASEALRILQIMKVKFKIDGKRIIVSK